MNSQALLKAPPNQFLRLFGLSFFLHAFTVTIILGVIVYRKSIVQEAVSIDLELAAVHVHEAGMRSLPVKPKSVARVEPLTSEATSVVVTDEAQTKVGGKLSFDSFPAAERNEYLARLYRLISESQVYPRASVLNEEEGVVQVKLELDGSGAVRFASVIKGSGFNRLDEAAITTLRNIARFPMPSPNLDGLTLLIPIRYELNPHH